MHYTPVYLNATIKCIGPDSATDYFFQWRLWSLTSPQLLLRRGTDRHAPVVNFAKYLPMSRKIQLGKGDCTTDARDELAVSELRRDKTYLQRGDYSFTWGGSDDAGEATSQTFRWCKNRGKRLRTIYACEDVEGRVVARM